MGKEIEGGETKTIGHGHQFAQFLRRIARIEPTPIVVRYYCSPVGINWCGMQCRCTQP